MKHFLVVLIVLIAYLMHSHGVHVSYKFHLRENITLSCIGEDEVIWRVRSPATDGVGYRIKAESPFRKLLEIKNATIYNIGFYDCYSKGNQDDIVRLQIIPDDSAAKELKSGYNPSTLCPVVIPPQ